MSDQHTPGPWPIKEPNGSGHGFLVGPAWLGVEAWSAKTRADAELISAAPGLRAEMAAMQKAHAKERKAWADLLQHAESCLFEVGCDRAVKQVSAMRKQLEAQ